MDRRIYNIQTSLWFQDLELKLKKLSDQLRKCKVEKRQVIESQMHRAIEIASGENGFHPEYILDILESYD